MLSAANLMLKSGPEAPILVHRRMDEAWTNAIVGVLGPQDARKPDSSLGSGGFFE